jgi:hypothetical protein
MGSAAKESSSNGRGRHYTAKWIEVATSTTSLLIRNNFLFARHPPGIRDERPRKEVIQFAESAIMGCYTFG